MSYNCSLQLLCFIKYYLSNFHVSFFNMSMNVYSVRSTQCQLAVKLLSVNWDCLLIFVENTGVEPVTSCVQGRRSSQLS